MIQMLVTDQAEAVKLNMLLSVEGLDSIKVVCPSCFKSGFLVSLWIKKVNPKPWYVGHKNGNEISWCRLGPHERMRLRKQKFINKRIVKRFIQQMRSFVLFSGGQDSLCTLLYAKGIAEELGKEVTAIFVDTTVSLPEVTQYAKEVSRTVGVRLEIVRPKTDFFTLAKQKGIPRIKSRWCCELLKIRPIEEYLEKVHEPKIIFDGIRAEESRVRRDYLPLWHHPTFKCISISPIFYWTQRKVNAYLRRWDLPPSPSQSLGFSAECWCGAYAKRSDFEKLLELHPDIYAELEEVEKARNFSFIYDYGKGKRVFLSDLRRKRFEGKKRKEIRC